jgi:hypothetical protein
MAYLLADKREGAVIPHLEPLLGNALVDHQLNTGDYLVCQKADALSGGAVTVVACFERKSLKDFASSLRDGRYESERRKMLELRSRTGCQLYFIIEGAAFPSPDWAISSGVKYQSVMSAMITLPMASAIHVMQTKDTKHTAERLRDFVHALDKISHPYTYPLLEGHVHSEEALAGSLVPTSVTGRYEKDPDTHCMEMWNKLMGISLTTAKLIVSKYSVAEFVGPGGPDTSKMKSASGRLLIKKARASLHQLQRGSIPHCQKLLAGVGNIGPGRATDIIASVPAGDKHPLLRLIEWGSGGMADIRIAQKGRTIRLGDSLAKRIINILQWKGGAAQPAAPAVQPSQPSRPAAPLAQPSQPAAPLAQPSQPAAPLCQPSQPAAPLCQPLQPAAPLTQPLQPAAPLAQMSSADMELADAFIDDI